MEDGLQLKQVIKNPPKWGIFNYLLKSCPSKTILPEVIS